MEAGTAPRIHNYRDYRDYLNDWFKAAKSTNPRMSFRYVARHLGLTSPNHFQLVVTKKRHFSKNTLERMQTLLRLSQKEQNYLDLLFSLAFEERAAKRDELEGKIARLSVELVETDVPYDQYALLSNALAWFLKMGALRFTGKTRQDIERLVIESCPFSVSANDVHLALELLRKINVIQLHGEKYVFDLDNLKTEWDFDDKKIKQFHYNNLMLAMHTIPWPISQRFFSNVTIPCNPALFETAKKEIRDLCLKLLNLSNAEVATADDCQQVTSIQFAMFPYFVFKEQ